MSKNTEHPILVNILLHYNPISFLTVSTQNASFPTLLPSPQRLLMIPISLILPHHPLETSAKDQLVFPARPGRSAVWRHKSSCAMILLK